MNQFQRNPFLTYWTPWQTVVFMQGLSGTGAQQTKCGIPSVGQAWLCEQGESLISLGWCLWWVWDHTGNTGPYWYSSWCLIREKERWIPHAITMWDCHRYDPLLPFSRREGGSFVGGRLAHPMFSGPCLMLCPKWVFYLFSTWFMSHIIHIHPASAGESFL